MLSTREEEGEEEEEGKDSKAISQRPAGKQIMPALTAEL